MGWLSAAEPGEAYCFAGVRRELLPVPSTYQRFLTDGNAIMQKLCP